MAIYLSVGVAPQAPLSAPIAEGQTVRVVITAQDLDSQDPVDVTGLRLWVRAPQSVVPVTYDQAQMDDVETGRWAFDLVLDTPGRWRLRAECDEPSPATREITIASNASGVISATPLGALLATAAGEIITTPDARTLTAARIDRLPVAEPGQVPNLRLVGSIDGEAQGIDYETLRAGLDQDLAASGAVILAEAEASKDAAISAATAAQDAAADAANTLEPAILDPRLAARPTLAHMRGAERTLMLRDGDLRQVTLAALAERIKAEVFAELQEPKSETVRIVLLGDSVTDYMSSVTIGADGFPNIAYLQGGYGTWLSMLSGGRIVYDQQDDLGKAGDRSDQILARLDAALARGASFLLLHIGHNDITQLTSYYGGDQVALRAMLLANIRTAVDAALASGITPVVLPIWPHANWSSAAQFEVCAAHVDDLEAYCTAAGVAYIDSYLPDLIDPETGAIRLDLGDGVHTNAPGAYLFARPVASWIGRRLETMRHKPSAVGTPIASSALSLEGTGGTFGSQPYSGQLATGWAGYGPTGALTQGTIVFSKRLRDDGAIEQVITWNDVVGTHDGTRHGFSIRLQSPDITPGDRIVVTCQGRLVAKSPGLAGLWAMTYEYNGTTPRFGELRGAIRWPDGVADGRELTLRTPPLTVRPNLGSSYLDVRLGVQVYETAGLTGEAAIWNVQVLKLPAAPAPPPPDPVDIVWSLDAHYGGASAPRWSLSAAYEDASYDLDTLPITPGAYALA